MASLLAPCCEAAQSLIFCAENKDVRPWIRQEGTGLNMALLDRVAQKLRLTFVYRRAPWQRCFDALERGEIDGIMGVSFKTDRLEYGAYPGGERPDASQRLNIDRYVLIHRKGNPIAWNGKKLSGLSDKPVGIQAGYSIAEQLLNQHVRIDEGSMDSSDLLHKLLLGRIAAAAMLEGQARSLLASDHFREEALEILYPALIEKPYYLMLSHSLIKQKKDLALSIWKTTEVIRESKEYKQLEEQTMTSLNKS